MTQVDVKEFSIPDRFTILTPDTWWRSQDPDVLLWLTYDDANQSGLLIDARHVEWNHSTAEQQIGVAAERFLNDSILQIGDGELRDANGVYWEADSYCTLRTKVTINEHHGWLFQFTFDYNRQIVYILHWNGPLDAMDHTIIPVLESFALQ